MCSVRNFVALVTLFLTRYISAHNRKLCPIDTCINSMLTPSKTPPYAQLWLSCVPLKYLLVHGTHGIF